jgi:hypothetical protein
MTPMKRERKSRAPTFLSLCFFGGVLGALVNSVFVWGMGWTGLNALLGIQIEPAMTWTWLRPRLVWGGIWGLLFIPSIYRTVKQPVAWGIVLGLVPTLNQLFYVFPMEAGKGMAGLRLGTLTPLLVLIANSIWGIVSAGWIKWGVGERQ